MTEQAIATDQERSSDSPALPDAARRTWPASLLREPLLHFLVLGGLLFGLHAFFQQSAAPGDQQIVVSAGKIEHLTAIFAKTWQRPPTSQELRGLIDDYLREEVAYREGMTMGLDQDDTIIRRRIRQKLDFFAEDLASFSEPTDAQLAEYLERHADSYRTDSQVSFRHILVDPAKNPGGVEFAFAKLLETLRADPTVDPTELGARTLLEPRYDRVSPREVANIFGDEFAGAIEQLPVQHWEGPVRSGYGLHAVFIDQREPGRMPSLDEVRDAVRRDWEHDQRRELGEQFYRGLLDKYQVSIEWPMGAEPEE